MKFKSYYRYNQLKVAFDLLNRCNGTKILDIGCGNGILEQHFSEHEVIGIDISLSALNNAKKNAPHAKYILADMRSLPIKDECIDKVALIAVLGGVPQDEEVVAFNEAKRVLKYGGHLVILVSQKRQPYSLLVPDRLLGGWKWRHFNAQFLQKQLTENGFGISKTIFVGAILSLSLSLFTYLWEILWGVVSRKIMGRRFIPLLPYRLLNKIEGIEFRPFRGKLRFFARFFYVVAKKVD